MTAELGFLERVTPALLARFDRPGPRYTSYPTAVEFTEQFTAADYRARLAAANQRADRPLSLYVHIPFCERRCTFCGCNVIITRQRERVERYLEYLGRELDLLAAALPERRELVQYHWGGGTPTHLDLEQIAALQALVTRHFTIADRAEVAIEVDPDVTSVEQLALLGELGFNRLSIGVQDFDPQVLAAIRRDLSYDRTAELLAAARRLGFASVNVDLVYGLPHQNPDQFARTIDQVIALAPERVAVYSFAYVPWIKPNQKRLDQDALPDRETKFALFAEALRRFLAAGYLQVGMDHFVRPDDEMGRAVTDRTLYRNFMGYTVHRAPDMLGVGVSSIGALAGAFAQNVKDTPSYEAALDEGEFPIERGYRLDEDDRIRQRVITELMCNFHLDRQVIERELGIAIASYFAPELEQLTAPGGPVEQGFVELTDEAISVSPLGRLFIRNVCMIFDRYLAEKSDGTPVFSRTV